MGEDSTYMATINKPDDNDGFQQKKEKSTTQLSFSKIKKFIKRLPFATIFLVLFSTSVPLLIYYFIIDIKFGENGVYGTCLVNDTFKISCGKENISLVDCESISCCYDNSTRRCYHNLPSKYSYFRSNNEYIPSLQRTPYRTEMHNNIQLSIVNVTEDIVKFILHSSNEIVEVSSDSTNENNYATRLLDDGLLIEVCKNDTGELIFTTAKGPLIISDTYWEWSFHLISDKLYGLGMLEIDFENVNATNTKVVYKNKVSHNVEPIFWAYNNGDFHGVIVRHDGPLEVEVLQSRLVILRGLVWDKIELELSMGPTPAELRKQQSRDMDTAQPPDWIYGVHVCRNSNSTDIRDIINDFDEDVLNSTKYTSECINENLFISLYESSGQETKLKDIVTEIKNQNKKFILYIPPQVQQSIAEASTDVFYKINGTNYIGRYLMQNVSYPDFSSPQIQDYISEIFSKDISKFILDNADGVVLTDNFPLDDTFTNMTKSGFPYLSENLQEAMANTVPWDAQSNSVTHIKMHNSYGLQQMKSFQTYFESIGKGDIVLMSSSNMYGTNNLQTSQNVNVTWTNLKMHLENAIFHSMIGNHFVSAPICGTEFYTSDEHERLCIRWYLIGITMPIFRISSYKPWRGYEDLPTQYGQKVALKAINTRNQLMPYFDTFLSNGEPLLRPMWFDFHNDKNTLSLKGQYMVGTSLLVVHPFTFGQNYLNIYLPPNVGVWYEFWGGGDYTPTKNNATFKLDIVETDWIAFIPENSIIPLKTEDDIPGFIVACKMNSDQCEATGKLYLQNEWHNISVETINNDSLTIKIDNSSSVGTSIDVKSFKIYTPGQSIIIKNVTLCCLP